MDEREEIRLAGLLSDILDGRAPADAAHAPAEIEALDALESANILRAGLTNEIHPSAAFDRELRQKLVAETSKRSRAAAVVPIFRRQWVRLALAAAMMMLVIAPSWNYMRQVELRTAYKVKMQRVQKYDKMYTSRIDQLRKNPDAFSYKRKSFEISSRREARLAELTNRWKTRRLEARMKDIRSRREM